MTDVKKHYETLLAEVYTWMGGGLAQKVSENEQIFRSAGILPKGCRRALDLGCGSGFQSLALASVGFAVVAVDSSRELLDELRTNLPATGVTIVHGDLRDANVYEPLGPFEIAVCMGDTLTHLQTIDEVTACMGNVRRNLEPGGRLIVSFRDLTFELKGTDRAIPVRLDDQRLMVTFLEYEPTHVVVNDMVLERQGDNWQMRKSAYRKLRLAPSRFAQLLSDLGYRNIRQSSERGFWTTIADA